MNYPTNRQRVQRAVKGKRFYCSRCDSCIVGKWGRCLVCGYKEHPKKFRD